VFLIVFVSGFGVAMSAAAFSAVSEIHGLNGVLVSGVGFGLGALARAQLDGLFGFFVGAFAVVGSIGYGFVGGADFFGAFVATFNFIGLDGVYFLFFFLFFIFLVIEFSATNHRVGWGRGLNVIVLGVHQTGGESVDFLFTERRFRAGLFGGDGFPCFMFGGHTGIVKRGGRIVGGRRDCLAATGGDFRVSGSFGFGEQPARQSTGRTAWDIG